MVIQISEGFAASILGVIQEDCDTNIDQNVGSYRPIYTNLYTVTFQKTWTFMISAVTTSNLANN
jgi:hypothetical protein